MEAIRKLPKLLKFLTLSKLGNLDRKNSMVAKVAMFPIDY
jgi:hypothetical protein